MLSRNPFAAAAAVVASSAQTRSHPPLDGGQKLEVDFRFYRRELGKHGGSNKTAPLKFFPLHLHSLPNNTAPSQRHPLTNPIPLSLGIDIPFNPDTDSYSLTPFIYLIHATRFNPFNAQQPQILASLSDPSSANVQCPSYSLERESLYFLAPSLGTSEPLNIEVMAKLEVEGYISRTGNVVPVPMPMVGARNAVQEYQITSPLVSLSKRCAKCGRWESMVRRPGTDENAPTKEKFKYRRWKTCSGCGVTWFCREECFRAAWFEGHWKSCEKLHGLKEKHLEVWW